MGERAGECRIRRAGPISWVGGKNLINANRFNQEAPPLALSWRPGRKLRLQIEGAHSSSSRSSTPHHFF